MRFIIAAIVALNFIACSHMPEPTAPAAPQYAFKVVSQSRQINAEAKKGKKTKAQKEEKFVEVSKCAPGTQCDDGVKLIPYEQFTAQLDKAAAKERDLVNRQQASLIKGLQHMKFEKARMVEEKAFYEHNIKTYKWASTKPVMDGYKKGNTTVAREIQYFDAKINKMEKGLDYLKNVKGIKLGMDQSTEKLMEMIETGHMNHDCDHDHDLLSKFFQNFGREVASN